ncbi:MAG: hypothetical protein JSR44_16020 [Spirochaetes bacterium]|nr:hypothetical protein [Spirochaetota bacterium]
MRFRSYIPLILYTVLSLLGGMALLFAWQDFPLELFAMHGANALLFSFFYHAGIRGALKYVPLVENDRRLLYLPLKVHVTLYFLIGAPIVFFARHSYTFLLVGHGVGLIGFLMTYASMMAFFRRSRE